MNDGKTRANIKYIHEELRTWVVNVRVALRSRQISNFSEDCVCVHIKRAHIFCLPLVSRQYYSFDLPKREKNTKFLLYKAVYA